MADYGIVTPSTVFTVRLAREAETQDIDRQNTGDGLLATAMIVVDEHPSWELVDAWVRGSRDGQEQAVIIDPNAPAPAPTPEPAPDTTPAAEPERGESA